MMNQTYANLPNPMTPTGAKLLMNEFCPVVKYKVQVRVDGDGVVRGCVNEFLNVQVKENDRIMVCGSSGNCLVGHQKLLGGF